ncbi:hypothetical protein V475_14750 [Sphingobium baderi LL03]|uniref:Uncharacterized protein n=1 Tax=Sphingobium baderi LL03 TaxID=1114964 RepID=T0GE86_9SPHN|nr:hypothetical protein L485_15690 [Sphingobium baderi LL03]KMS61603.1 hypothetical protein V475_14750 [Sphingobium baderi LL03]
MMTLRSRSVMRLQRAISSSVRPHPVHVRPVSSSRQTLMQGLSITIPLT